MEKVFFDMMDKLCKDCMVYKHKKHIWLINPHTKEWIISYFTETKYVWWSYDFFQMPYNLLSINIKDKQFIRNWVQSRMKVEVGNNCEPDMLPGEYDWSSDFDIGDVLTGGKVFNI